MLKQVMFALLFASVLAAAAEETGEPPAQRGLIQHDPGVADGYVFFAPLDTSDVFLMDNDGHLIRHWESDYQTGVAYLLPNGHVLKTSGYGRRGNKHFHGGGASFRIEEFDWDGNKVWEYVYASEEYLMHHDIEPLPNGNVLILAWERKTKEEAIAAGRDPEVLNDDMLWSEHVIEVKPTFPEGGEIVWQWHLWDHLIQDFDSSKENFGEVAAHPERIEVNPPGFWLDVISDEEREQMEALGYLDALPDAKDIHRRKARAGSADWLHINAIAYNPQLDQIALSVLGNNEIWIFDHSTTTEEARTSEGGRAGKGGDILYRWGNPMAYRLGNEDDQTLFAQHDVRWIPEGYPGAGNLTIFNNGRGRKGKAYSSVIEIKPPLQADGTYARVEGKPFGPDTPAWEYTAEEKKDFYSSFISGAHRLWNGNTIVCSGADGNFFEVTPEKKVVWRYINPAQAPDEADHRNGNEKASNFTFRVYRYPTDYPAFATRDLTPGPLLTDYVAANPPKTPNALHRDYPHLGE